MAEADPRSFWQRFKRQDRTEGNISVEQWHDFFSDLLSCPPGEPEAAAETLQPHHRGYNSGDVHTAAASANEPATPHPLDVDITADEVIVAVGKLKRNKAAGIDGIRADFLKDATELLIPQITALFNKAFVEGRL
ncbi:hypothetical protein COCOBI_08-0810 [Coccomyxa sp. Obi]|nr:hypothetical protein COCOBI_08-0810 [Coccomyxa sp. Obi]